MSPRTTDRQPLDAARQAAYRRLAITILGLDVPTLTDELRRRRLAGARQDRSTQRSSRFAA